MLASVSQVLALLAVVTLADGARIARKRRTAVIAQDSYSMYDGLSLLKLAPCTHDAVKRVQEFVSERQCLMVVNDFLLELPEGGGCAEVVAACEEEAAIELLKELGENAIVLNTDAGAYYRNESGTAKGYVQAFGANMSSDFYADWRDLAAIEARVEAVVRASGGVATLEEAGKSIEGRSIKAVRFRGKGFSAGKPRLVFSFNLHAREWIAGMAGTYAVEMLAAKVKADAGFLAGMEVVMVPMANPDGFHYTATKNRFHRKNMRKIGACIGVDNNRNGRVAWGKAGASRIPCMDTYRGSAPGSEPETQALEKIFKEAPMTVYFDVHSYTQLILSAWSYTKEDHPRKREFAALGSKIQAAVEGKHGKTYKLGPGAQTLYAASGTLADYATSLGALGYVLELRPAFNQGPFGFAPPAKEVLPCAEEVFEGILAAVAYARTTR
jgi:hypothetical protein